MLKKEYKLIVAVDNNNYGIGKDNKLLWKVPADLKQFKETTLNNIVIMGRKTFDSLNRKPLKNRYNIVFSRHRITFYYEDDFRKLNYGSHIIDGKWEKALEFLLNSKYLNNVVKGFKDLDKWVIGGSEIYELFSEYYDTACISLIRDTNKTIDDYDSFFDINKIVRDKDVEVVINNFTIDGTVNICK